MSGVPKNSDGTDRVGLRSLATRRHTLAILLGLGTSAAAIATRSPLVTAQETQEETSETTRSETPSSGSSAARRREPLTGPIVIEGAVVKADREIDVPAPVTGRIARILVDDNHMVAEGTVIAQIEDGRAQMTKRLAQARLDHADMEANDESAILEAEATLELARSELRRNTEAGDAITESEREQSELEVRQAELRLDARRKQKELAIKRLEIARLEVEEADAEIARHQVAASAAANVFAIYHDAGEWVTEGEPMIRLVRMELLRVEGQVDKYRYNREDLHGKRVTVEFERARGEKINFEGQVTWTGLREAAGQHIQVRATISNRVVAEHFVLHPGAIVRLIVHQDEPPQTAANDLPN